MLKAEPTAIQDPLFDPDPLFCVQVDIKEGNGIDGAGEWQEERNAWEIQTSVKQENIPLLYRNLKAQKASFADMSDTDSGNGLDSNDSNDDSDQESQGKKTRKLPEATPNFPKVASVKFNPSLIRRNQSTSAFIDLYRSQRCLWDRKDTDYYDNEARADAQKYISDEILAQFNVTVDHIYLSSLIKKIRVQYCAIRSAMESQSVEKLTASTIEHYKRCDFLEDIQEEVDDQTRNELKGVKSKIRFNPTFYRRNPRTVKFIELYKDQPCLWNTTASEYKHPAACAKAYTYMMNEIENNFNVTLNLVELEAIIQKVRQQYCVIRAIVEEESTDRLPDCALEHYRKCKFLGDIEEVVDDCNKHELKDVKNKNKFLIFARLKGDAEAFIDIYLRFPMLYDPKNPDYGSNMKRRDYYNTMAKVLVKEVNISITPEKLYDYVVSLRRWYKYASGRLKNGKPLTDEEQKYFEKLKFLPEQKKNRRKYNCTVCGCLLLSEISVQAHLFEAHQIGELPLKCPECGMGFKKKSQLHYHTERFHQAKIYHCTFCEWKFSVIADYRNHLKTHSNEKPHVCELCGKAFRKHCQLNDHVNAVHTKLRPFKCTMCPKQFLKQALLNTHMKSHLDIRDKICETCGKGFTNCHALIRHRQIHSEIKKFACTMCDARYSQFSPLNRHLKRTHKIVRNNKTSISID